MKFQDSLKCKYFKKEANDEVYFWHVNKHRSFLQVGTIILGEHIQACTKYPKKPKVYISSQYLHKNR